MRTAKSKPSKSDKSKPAKSLTRKDTATVHRQLKVQVTTHMLIRSQLETLPQSPRKAFLLWAHDAGWEVETRGPIGAGGYWVVKVPGDSAIRRYPEPRIYGLKDPYMHDAYALLGEVLAHKLGLTPGSFFERLR